MSDAAVGSRPRRGVYYGWVVVAATFLVYTAFFSIQYSFGVFFKPLQDSFGWSRAATSLAMTLHISVFALSMVPAAWLLDRFNKRAVFSIAAVAAGASLWLASQVSQQWQLYLLWGLPLAVSYSIFGSPTMAIITRWFVRRRGLALGIASGGVGFGTLIGAPVADWLINLYGWRGTFSILGIATGVVMLACAQFLKGNAPPSLDQPVDAPPPRQAPARSLTMSQALRSSQLYALVIAQIFALFMVRMIMVHIAPYAIDSGITASTAALAVGAIGGVSIVGRMAMGFVQDRIGPRRALIICLVGQGIAVLALPFIRTDALFFVFALVFGLSYGGDIPQVAALTAQLFGLASIELVYGLVQSLCTLGGSLGPITAGYVFDQTGSYTGIFLASTASVFIGVALISRLKPANQSG